MKHLATWWQAFCHWKGWNAIAGFCQKAWRAFLGWGGWKWVFGIPFPALLPLCAACAAGLAWVFAADKTQWIPAYLLYALSAYALTALCVKLPAALRDAKAWLSRHPRLARLLADHTFLFALKLYLDQLINFAYGLFKILSGVVIGSAWVGCDGIYNMAQALIQLFQILRRRKPGSMLSQWKSYRFCGVLVLLMHLTMTGIVFQMVNWNRAEEQGQIMVIATAAFAFYKFIGSFIELAKDRKHTRPIDSSVRMLELSQAAFAIFSLQASMLHTFGSGESWEQPLNAATGCAVCLMVTAMGIYMLRRGSREIRKIQENEHGQ